MAINFKIRRTCCFNLSTGCLFFGLLNLAAIICDIEFYSIFAYQPPDIEVLYTPRLFTMNILALVETVIEICTYLLMMYGSMMNYRWLLLPHIAWEIHFIISFAIEDLTLSILTLLSGNGLFGLMHATMVFGILPLHIFFWIVMYNRYLEIEEKQAAPPNLIEMNSNRIYYRRARISVPPDLEEME